MTAIQPPARIKLPMGVTAVCEGDEDGSWIYAISDGDGREVGAAVLSVDSASGCFTDIWLAPHIRRKGVATALYDAVEDSGIDLIPSSEQDEDGAMFWESRLSSKASGIRMR